MKFEEAYKKLMDGQKIRHKGWEALMHLRLENGNVITYRGEITNFVSDSTIFMSNKWLVVHGDGKELSFVEALEALKEKKFITHEFLMDGYIFIDQGNFAVCRPIQYPFLPTFKEFCSNEWEIMK